MNALKIGLMVLVAALLLVVVIDDARATAPLIKLRDSLDSLQKSVDMMQAMSVQQGHELDRLQKQLTDHPVMSATVPTATTSGPSDATATSPDQDGNPKLGINFLLPYNQSLYHPEWASGTLHEFKESPKLLNPLIDNSKITQDIWGMVNDSLCERPYTHPETWSQLLATSVIISDDYKVYTFTIRPGVMWQIPELAKQPKFAWLDKPVELTADDFKFALDLILDPAVDCPSLRNYYEDLDHAEAVDRYTFKMVWKRKVYTSVSFSLSLAPMPRQIYQFSENGTPLAKNQIGISFNQNWFDREHGMIGVGNYCLKEFVPDVRIALRRNPGYWGGGLNFNEIVYDLQIQRPDAQLTAFKNGQVQDLESLSSLNYKSNIIDHSEPRFAAIDPANPKAGRTGDLGWERGKALNFSYIGWNMRKAPFDDVRVRQAMSYAFPKQRLIKQVFYGLGTPVLSDVPPGSQYLNTDLEPYDYDLDKARALLAQAGWTDPDGSGQLSKVINGQKQVFAFTFKTFANAPALDNALLIYKNELLKIGVHMEVVQVEWKEMMRVYEDKDFQATFGSWSMSVDLDYYQLWHSSQADAQGGSNFCGFKNQEVDDLAVKLRATFDTAERIAIVKRLQAIINEQQPYTFFKSGEVVFVWQNQGPPAAGRYLDGVTYGLDHLPELFNRQPVYWHIRGD